MAVLFCSSSPVSRKVLKVNENVREGSAVANGIGVEDVTENGLLPTNDQVTAIYLANCLEWPVFIFGYGLSLCVLDRQPPTFEY